MSPNLPGLCGRGELGQMGVTCPSSLACSTDGPRGFREKVGPHQKCGVWCYDHGSGFES